MLETTSLGFCLLLITQYLRNYLDVSGKVPSPKLFPASDRLLFNSLKDKGSQVNIHPYPRSKRSAGSPVGENDKISLCNNRGVQSAENFLGFSETIRQLPYFSNFPLFSSLFSFSSAQSCSKNTILYKRFYSGNKQNCNDNIISKRNCYHGSGEEAFFQWFAGVIDGDGNFDIRKNNSGTYILKAIRIKLHNRDLRLLTYIQDKLHMGRIRASGTKPHSIYVVSTEAEMRYLLTMLNGLIRIKVDSFKRACDSYDIQ